MPINHPAAAFQELLKKIRAKILRHWRVKRIVGTLADASQPSASEDARREGERLQEVLTSLGNQVWALAYGLIKSSKEKRAENPSKLTAGLLKHAEIDPKFLDSVFQEMGWSRPPVTFQTVFEAEKKQIEASRNLRNPHVHNPSGVETSLIGLAFSGGGIRSATFNLGILQALAEEGLLRRFDYLSTVSGGGYIGSWLAALTRRFTATVQGSKFADIEKALVPPKYEHDKRNEATFLHWLRMYSNYLTPQMGLVSGDTWAMVGTWLRNVFLNQMILGLILTGAFVLCSGGLLLLVETEVFAEGFVVIGGLYLFLAAILMAVNLVERAAVEGGPRHWFERIMLTVTVFVPFVLACVPLNWGLWLWRDLANSPVLYWAAAGAGFYFAVWGIAAFVGWALRSTRTPQGKEQRRMVSIPALLISSPVAGAVGASLLKGYSLLLGNLPPWCGRNWIVAVFGSGIIMLAVLITGALHTGLVGRWSQDLVREWWARLGGYLWLFIMGWLLLAGTCALGPLLVRWAIFKLSGWSLAAALLWIANNYLGLKVASGAMTSGKEEKATTASPEVGDADALERGASKTTKAVELLKSPRVLEVVAKVAPYIFAAGLILLFSTAVHIGIGLVFDRPHTKDLWLLSHVPRAADWHSLSNTYWIIQKNASSLSLLVAGPLLLLAGLGLSWRVDVNDFSLHHFYRNRLVRCYLGASNPDRSPEPFTGFDPCDDLPLKDFAGEYPGLYPILNATLNVTSGDDLGYTTRKAKSFVFTPLYCGYDLRILGKGPGRFTRDNGYEPSFSLTADGRSKEARAAMQSERGIGLGTAMAISGAAASPNMGYFTSPGTAFFMTLFDLRLGWWMGNSRCEKKWQSPGPRLGISYLFSELLGQSDQYKSYVYLSDGGHFENLAVYELIKRHCKVIVACDAGCDAKYQFEDLIALIEKARTDFGARIDIDFTRIRPQNGRESEYNFVVGTIYYDPQDRKDQGKLVYIKASMPKRERKKPRLPDDVWLYFDRHKTFPHQSTADQWFDELQFESYRALGECIGEAAAEEIGKSIRDVL